MPYLKFKWKNINFTVQLSMHYLTHPLFGWFPVFSSIDNAAVNRAYGYVGRFLRDNFQAVETLGQRV